ncbi:hypothetical protein PR202_ga19876 [Eleusine coracana subsp. coracana]|uniref:Uncharacterized protein n=1 Tax=Eleusine coracana subsp. coracana TaxID=191504 RepID=A0AAV5CWH2_ELECO|nr:hypothetical protein PR202_ga19876 [Eleusine coracana subsp. coracana]
MARPAAKARPAKHLVALAVVAVLGLVLVADFLWASSSSSASSPAIWSSRLNLGTGPAAVAPPAAKVMPVSLSMLGLLDCCCSGFFLKTSPVFYFLKQKMKDKKYVGSMDINATFADLPAPELKWEEMSEAPVVRLDGAAIQIKNLLYVFAGYSTINDVRKHACYFFHIHACSSILKYSQTECITCDSLYQQSEVHSHVDVYNFSDNSWGGRGPTARNFVLDTETREWHDLPPLPVPRYAPATQLWRGRLHVMGGSKEDRHEPGLEHWSLAVKDGKALEKGWRSEIPIPRGGPHRCLNWLVSLLMISFSLLVVKKVTSWPNLDPLYLSVLEEVRYVDMQEWTVIGRLPFRIKTTLVGYWDGWLYFTSGQRDKGPKDPSPKKIVGSMWRTNLHL